MATLADNALQFLAAQVDVRMNSGDGELKLSVIVPLYNEEESVEPLCQSIVAAVDPLQISYEVILVDDGSVDQTFAAAKRMAEDDRRIRVIKFRSNAGQTPAMAAGIDYALGETLVTMDGDLQNDPRDIATLIEKLEEGFDLVVGWRFDRQDKLITRRIPSVAANWLIGKVTGLPIKDNGCSLKSYRASVIKSVALYSEMHRFIPAMASIVGARIAQISVRHHARQFGESKYGLPRIYAVLLDLLIVKTVTSFSGRPLLWFSVLAMPAMVLGTLFLIGGLAIPLVGEGTLILPLAGSGLLMLSLAVSLFLGGAFAELVFKTGDVRPAQAATLTARWHSPQGANVHGGT